MNLQLSKIIFFLAFFVFVPFFIYAQGGIPADWSEQKLAQESQKYQRQYDDHIANGGNASTGFAKQLESTISALEARRLDLQNERIHGPNNGIPSIGSYKIADPTPSAPSRGGVLGGTKYEPITPGGETFFEGKGFDQMLMKIFQLMIYFTVILSVIMIIVGGVEYMGSESVFKKGEGKERIYAAISGLLIALVSILIISTILPGYSGDSFTIDIFKTSGGK